MHLTINASTETTHTIARHFMSGQNIFRHTMVRTMVGHSISDWNMVKHSMSGQTMARHTIGGHTMANQTLVSYPLVGPLLDGHLMWPILTYLYNLKVQTYSLITPSFIKILGSSWAHTSTNLNSHIASKNGKVNPLSIGFDINIIL